MSCSNVGNLFISLILINSKKKKLVVRSASKQGKIQTLDQKEREIPEGILLIYDGNLPIDFAGVMGDLHSAISENTKKMS